MFEDQSPDFRIHPFSGGKDYEEVEIEEIYGYYGYDLVDYVKHVLIRRFVDHRMCYKEYEYQDNVHEHYVGNQVTRKRNSKV